MAATGAGSASSLRLLALSVHLAGGDLAISGRFFDPSTGEFPLRDQNCGVDRSQAGKSLVVSRSCGLLAAAASSSVAECTRNGVCCGPVDPMVRSHSRRHSQGTHHATLPLESAAIRGTVPGRRLRLHAAVARGPLFPGGSLGGWLFAVRPGIRREGPEMPGPWHRVRHRAHCGHRLQPGSGRPGSAFPEPCTVGGVDRLALRRAGLQALPTLRLPDHARGPAVMPRLRLALDGADGGGGQ